MFCRNNINRSIRWIFLALTQGMLLWYSSTVVVGHCGILSSFSEFSSKTYDKNEFEVQWREAQNFKLSQDSLQGFKKKMQRAQIPYYFFANHLGAMFQNLIFLPPGIIIFFVSFLFVQKWWRTCKISLASCLVRCNLQEGQIHRVFC